MRIWTVWGRTDCAYCKDIKRWLAESRGIDTGKSFQIRSSLVVSLAVLLAKFLPVLLPAVSPGGIDTGNRLWRDRYYHGESVIIRRSLESGVNLSSHNIQSLQRIFINLHRNNDFIRNHKGIDHVDPDIRWIVYNTVIIAFTNAVSLLIVDAV